VPILHDPAVRSSIEARLATLTPDSVPRWGTMSVDQMLWHVSQAMASAVGRVAAVPDRAPLPRPVMKFLVLRMPWPKGAPTNGAFKATGRHDFVAERARCLELIRELTAMPLDGAASPHPMFGRMSCNDVSRLHAKHLDHHLRQFGA
jgi:hypothetical protein